MAIDFPKKILMLSAMMVVSSVSWAQPLAVSIPPRQDQNPTFKPEQNPGSAAAIELIDLLNCVDQLAQGHFAAGEKACSDAIALNSNNAASYKLRGYGYLLEHRFERAQADFEVSLKLKPNDAESRAGFAQSLSGEGKFADAVREFSKAIALAPASAPYWNGRCWAQAGTGQRLGRALTDCNKALALMPGAAGALNSRGLVYLRSGQFQTAITDYTRSLAARPEQPSAQFGRGLARLRLGQHQAGTSDIALARQADGEIDALFVLMGVVPKDCARQPAKPNCPPPSRTPTEKPSSAPMMQVSLQLETDDDDDVVLAIEAGRLDIMLDQMTLLLHQPKEHTDTLRLDDISKILWLQLSVDVVRFNHLLPLACRARRAPDLSCIAPYHPAWLEVSRTADPSLAIEDIFLHVGPLWSALCTGHKKVCRIE